MSGQLVEFPLLDGDTLKEGELIGRFNCALPEATAARARAEVDRRRDILATQQSLRALNSYSKADFKTAQNDVTVAQADLAVAQTAVANCVVRAPFAGRVSNILAHNFQFVPMGAPMVDILDDRDLELQFIVPSHWLSWLAVGTKLLVRIGETRATYEARITRFSGSVDAASQTIKIYGRIDGPAPGLLPGMTGNASFPDAPKP